MKLNKLLEDLSPREEELKQSLFNEIEGVYEIVERWNGIGDADAPIEEYLSDIAIGINECKDILRRMGYK